MSKENTKGKKEKEPKKEKVDTTENLIPFNKRTKDEVRKITRKGGIESGKTRRAKRDFKNVFNTILELDVKDKKLLKHIEQMGVNTEIDNKTLLAVTTFKKALKGDMRAFELIRDTIGEKPKEKIEVNDVTPKWFKSKEDEEEQKEKEE